MELRIKLFLAFLAVIAVFDLYKTSNKFRFLSLADVGIPVTSQLPGVNNDPDNDGLTNSEEDYWTTNPNNADTDGDGYLDGDEVVNGYDPLISGLTPIGGSVTDQFVNLTLSGFVEGSLKEDSPNYFQSLDDITSSVIDRVEAGQIASIEFPTVQSTRENQQIYLESLKPIFKDLLIAYYGEAYQLIDQLENLGAKGFSNSEVISFFSQYTNIALNISRSFQDVKVPENWKKEHEILSSFVTNFRNSNSSLQKGQVDPINATNSLNALIDMAESVPSLVEAYEQKIKKEELGVKNYFQSIQ